MKRILKRMQKSECKMQNKEGKWSSIRSAFCILTSAFIVLIYPFALLAADVPTTQPLTNFVRFDEDGHGGGKMQAAIGHYVNGDGISVDLLSTTHIGQQAFFRDLSKRFPKYDSVLYELVAPRGVPADEEGVNDQQRQIARDCDLEKPGAAHELRPEKFRARGFVAGRY